MLLLMQSSMCQAEMEKRKNAPLPDGQQPKSDVEVVAEVLKEKCPSTTFLLNVGLESSSSRNKSIRSSASAVVDANVRDLKEKLQRSEMVCEAMQEEIAAMKRKSEEAEATRVKEFEMLRQRAEDQDAKFAQMMALLDARSAE